MKICVYAISKNEEKFAKRWIKSMSEADEIIVLDSFSTDKTVKILKDNGAKVYSRNVTPWRFDEARNQCLKYLPKDTDLCVCTDLDEIFEKGWRKKLESNYKKGVKQIFYKYIWNHNEDGSNGITFYANKIHTRNDFTWKNPVHEVLEYISNDAYKKIISNDIVLHHYADNSKSRARYLKLLELSVKENPNNDRNTHYLGREYFFYQRYEDCIRILKKHLSMPSSIWKDERSSSLIYIAKSYLKLKKNYLAKKYFKLACIESPNLREPRLDFAEYLYDIKKYQDALYVLLDLLKIKERNYTYISLPKCWNHYPYDLASFCFYKIKDYKSALIYSQKAFEYDQNNERIKNNILYYENILNKKNI